MDVRDVRETLSRVAKVSSSHPRIAAIIQPVPSRLSHLLIGMGVPKNQLVQLFKQATYDEGLLSSLNLHFQFSDWQATARQWKFEETPVALLQMIRLLMDGSRLLAQHIDDCVVVKDLHLGHIATTSKTSDIILERLVNQSQKGATAAKKGIKREEDIQRILTVLRVPFRTYARATSTSNTSDVIVGLNYVETSRLESDGSGVATKTSAIISNVEKAKGEGRTLVALLDGPGWRARPEFQKLIDEGVKVFTDSQLPDFFAYLCQGIGMQVRNKVIKDVVKKVWGVNSAK